MNIFSVECFRVIMALLFVLCCINSSAISFSFLQIWLVFFSYSQLFSFSLFIVKFLVVEVRCFHVHYHVLHKPLEFFCFMELFAFLITVILYFYTFPDQSIPSRQVYSYKAMPVYSLNVPSTCIKNFNHFDHSFVDIIHFSYLRWTLQCFLKYTIPMGNSVPQSL